MEEHEYPVIHSYKCLVDMNYNFYKRSLAYIVAIWIRTSDKLFLDFIGLDECQHGSSGLHGWSRLFSTSSASSSIKISGLSILFSLSLAKSSSANNRWTERIDGALLEHD